MRVQQHTAHDHPMLAENRSTNLLQGGVVALNDAREHALHADHVGALVVGIPGKGEQAGEHEVQADTT